MATIDNSREDHRRGGLRAPVSFLIQLVIATGGAIVLGTLAALIPSALFAAITKNSSGGNFIDHMIEQRFFVWADKSDLVIVASAFVLGIFACRVFRSSSSAFVWVPATLILLWNLLTWEGAGALTMRSYWIDVWNNYFADCGSSECFYKLFVTVPFYTSSAYSLGWLSTKFLRRSRTPTVRQ